MSRVDIQFEPIRSPLPPPSQGFRSAGGFRAAWSVVIHELRHELAKIEATDVRLYADLDRSQIRKDGLPYDDARARTPGVTLALCKEIGGRRVELSYPSGAYATMKANIRAISLTLERLRDIDRYGVGSAGQQYRAYSALPPGQVAEWTTPGEAMRFLVETSGELPDGWKSIDAMPSAAFAAGASQPETARRFYRAAARKAHPDAGGSAELFNRVSAAWALVESAHAQ